MPISGDIILGIATYRHIGGIMENKQTEKTEIQSEKTKKKPFKQTRELVRLALNNGWTQTEIAKTCRTQQSVVSAWSKGEKLATEQQLKPLLNLFGYKLRRNTFKLYWRKNAETSKIEFIKVEGKIIFSLLIGKKDDYNKFVPKYKFIIHYQGNEQFYVILKEKIYDDYDKSLEAATWQTVFNQSIGISELLQFFDNLSSKDLENMGRAWWKFCHDFPNYTQSLPFLVRQALLNQGFSVDNIIEYPASW